MENKISERFTVYYVVDTLNYEPVYSELWFKKNKEIIINFKFVINLH